MSDSLYQTYNEAGVAIESVPIESGKRITLARSGAALKVLSGSYPGMRIRLGRGSETIPDERSFLGIRDGLIIQARFERIEIEFPTLASTATAAPLRLRYFERFVGAVESDYVVHDEHSVRQVVSDDRSIGANATVEILNTDDIPGITKTGSTIAQVHDAGFYSRDLTFVGYVKATATGGAFTVEFCPNYIVSSTGDFATHYIPSVAIAPGGLPGAGVHIADLGQGWITSSAVASGVVHLPQPLIIPPWGGRIFVRDVSGATNQVQFHIGTLSRVR
jgi:hypothetical protein